MKGTAGHKRVPVNFVEKYKIPLAPLPEQKAIVQKIENIFSHCDKTEKCYWTEFKKYRIIETKSFKKSFFRRVSEKKELEICYKSPDWKSAKQLLKEIQQEKNRN